MNIEKEYNYFASQHAKYEKKSLSILLKELKVIFKNIPFRSLNFDEQNTYNTVLLNINQEEFQKVLYKINYTTGISHGNEFSRRLRKENPIQLKRWNPLPFFSQEFQQFLLNYYREYGGRNIMLLSETIAETVVNEIKLGTIQGETVEQMRDRIYKTVNRSDFYKWQALRIARTETTFAMNAANEISGEVSGVILEKVWIGRNDGRERATHLANNGKRIGQNELFTVGNSKMKYPGDGTNGAEAKELIQCRCTFGYEPKRDENGRLIFTDF